jgi:hypothetical protein
LKKKLIFKKLLKDCSNISSSNLSFSLQQTLPKTTGGGSYQTTTASACSIAATSSAIAALASGFNSTDSNSFFTLPQLPRVERLEKKSVTAMIAELLVKARKSRDQAKAERDTTAMKVKAMQEENVELEARLTELRKKKEESLLVCRREQETIHNLKLEAIKSGKAYYLFKQADCDRIENG